MATLPLALAIRPLDDTLTMSATTLSVAEELTEKGGQNYRAVRTHDAKIFVTDDTRCLPVYYQGFAKNKELPMFDIHIEYEATRDEIWLPKSWTIRRLQGEQTVQTTFASVTKASINEPVSTELFSYEFPTGTWVTDVSNKAKHLIRNGKRTRPNSIREESLVPHGRSHGVNPRWWVSLAGSIVVVSLAFWWRRRPGCSTHAAHKSLT